MELLNYLYSVVTLIHSAESKTCSDHRKVFSVEREGGRKGREG